MACPAGEHAPAFSLNLNKNNNMKKWASVLFLQWSVPCGVFHDKPALPCCTTCLQCERKRKEGEEAGLMRKFNENITSVYYQAISFSLWLMWQACCGISADLQQALCWAGNGKNTLWWRGGWPGSFLARAATCFPYLTTTYHHLPMAGGRWFWDGLPPAWFGMPFSVARCMACLIPVWTSVLLS